MSKVLLTGMTSPQTSARLGARNINFAGLLKRSLEARGHSVEWQPASVDWDADHLSQYDSVLIGVAPVTSLSANYTYGALKLIYLLWEDPRLRLFLDAPDVGQIQTSLQSAVVNEHTLFKRFYRLRRDYEKVVKSAELMTYTWGACRALLNDPEWPITLYPELPWNDLQTTLEKALPGGARGRLEPINLDSLILIDRPVIVAPTGNRWLIDAPKTTWSKSTMATVSTQVAPVKWHKGWTDEQIRGQLGLAVGVLVSPQKPGGTWWSPYYAMALTHNVPVASYWQDTVRLGGSWAHLAASIEAMSEQERAELATTQRDTYASGIPTVEDSAEALQHLLNIETGETSK